MQTVLTNDAYKPAEYSAIFDILDEKKVLGVTITHDSDTLCTASESSEDENYRFITDIYCDESID